MRDERDVITSRSIFGWLALGTALILSIPLIAMQFTEEVNWTLSDFILMGIVIYFFGSFYVAIARLIDRKYRLIVGLLVLLAFLWLWAELAVGVFTSLGS